MLVTSGRRHCTRSNVLAPFHQPETSRDLQPTSHTRTCRLRKSSPTMSILLPLLNIPSLHLRHLLLLLLLLSLPPTLLSLHDSINIMLHPHTSRVILRYLVFNTARLHRLTSYHLHHLLSHINLRRHPSQLNLLLLSHREPFHASLYATKLPPRHTTTQTGRMTQPIWNNHTNQNPQHEPRHQDKKASHNATWKRWAGRRAKASAKKQQV